MVKHAADADAAMNVNMNIKISQMWNILVLKSNMKKISNIHNYTSIYLQVSPIEKVRSRYEVLIVKEGTAISPAS